ncbi:hypothetical protein ONZ45_g13555 [Pleurotus djamor]|nr:hypothetical protein ONZ45_g13555 [Pleurotus djamor]
MSSGHPISHASLSYGWSIHHPHKHFLLDDKAKKIRKHGDVHTQNKKSKNGHTGSSQSSASPKPDKFSVPDGSDVDTSPELLPASLPTTAVTAPMGPTTPAVLAPMAVTLPFSNVPPVLVPVDMPLQAFSPDLHLRHVSFSSANVPRGVTAVLLPVLVKQQIDGLEIVIQQWKERYHLPSLGQMIQEIEQLLDFDDKVRVKNLSGQDFIDKCLRRVNTVFLQLESAYASSFEFQTRFILIAAYVPGEHLTLFFYRLQSIQRDRIVLRHALHIIISTLQHWLGRPSVLLTKVATLILKDPIPNDFASVGILSSKEVSLLAPGNWLDDNTINYFCGNHSGGHMSFMGRDGEVLYCSPLFWSSLATNKLCMHRISVNSENFNSQSLSKVRRMLMPVHRADHWVLIHCRLMDGVLELYDSMSEGGSATSGYDQLIQIVKLWLIHYRERYRIPFADPTTWTLHVPMENIPQQQNTDDCGVYVIVLRFWMELPKTAQQWQAFPEIIRFFPTYEFYAENDIPV